MIERDADDAVAPGDMGGERLARRDADGEALVAHLERARVPFVYVGARYEVLVVGIDRRHRRARLDVPTSWNGRHVEIVRCGRARPA